MYAPGVRQAVGGRPLRHLAAKRGLDVLVAGLVLLLLAPLLLAIALAVKLTSRGPVVLRQERIGLDGRPFMLLRFRTMYADKRLDALRAQRLNIAQDQRPSRGLVPKRRRNHVTRVGRVLHRYSLNVLPQLINVLRGEMTLVGPRPLWPDEIDLVDSGWSAPGFRPGRDSPGLGRVAGGRHRLYPLTTRAATTVAC
jgi:lipopolysaccharide/colanic/teichoic acid biosynthesis glycosyltransferase